MSKAPRSSRGGLLFGAGLGVVITIAMIAGGGPSRAVMPGTAYSPAADLPRWTGEPFDVTGLGTVADFDIHAGTMYLLDASSHQVRVLQRDGDQWLDAGEFGGAGAGPGEFVAAQGVAVTVDGALVVVADDSRLHFFTGGGTYLHSSSIGTDCLLLRPRVAAGQRGFFVTGNCYRVGGSTDTMASVLYWSADGLRYEQVASDVRFTRDGRTGSFLSAVSTLSESDSLHLFGTGSTACIHEVREQADGPPAAQRTCDIVDRRYSAPAPPALAAQLRAEQGRRDGEALLAWPDPLPAYLGRVMVDSARLLLRPFTADSLVIEEVGAGASLFVAGLDGLVACRRRGCLWSEPTVTGARLRLLEIDAIRQLIRPDREAGPWDR